MERFPTHKNYKIVFTQSGPKAAIDQNLDELETTVIDIETGANCGGTLRVIAYIEEPALIARILGHVQQREELNDPLARAPPGQQEQTFNLI